MPPVVLVVVVPEPLAPEPLVLEPLVLEPLVLEPAELVAEPEPAPGPDATPGAVEPPAPAVLAGVVDEGPPVAVPDDEDASDPEVGVATDDPWVDGATEAAWPGLAFDPLHPTVLAASTAMMRWMDDHPRALMQTPPRVSRAFPFPDERAVLPRGGDRGQGRCANRTRASRRASSSGLRCKLLPK
jgi:hypothetical protein